MNIELTKFDISNLNTLFGKNLYRQNNLYKFDKDITLRRLNNEVIYGKTETIKLIAKDLFNKISGV